MQGFLQNHTKTFLSLLDKLQEGIIIHSQDTSVIYANPIAVKILGFHEDELMGKSLSNHPWYFIDEDGERLPPHKHPVNKIFQMQESIQDELIGIKKEDATIVWVKINGAINYDERGEPFALILIDDVTARKSAFDRAELFQNLINTISVGVTIADMNKEDNPLIYVNDAFCTLTGYTKEETLGKNCRFLQKDDTDQSAISEIRSAMKDLKSCRVTLKNYTKEGRLFYNSLSISPYFKNEKLLYYIGIQHDVTKLKEQEIYIQSILNAQKNIVIVNDRKNIIYANSAFLDFFSVKSIADFLKHNDCICDFFIEDDDYFHIKRVPKEQHWAEYLLEHPQESRIVKIESQRGEESYFQIEIEEMLDTQYVITLSDITKIRLKEKLLTSMAYHDNLTKAYNRQYFYEIFLNEIFTPLKSYGITIFDIDNFKSLNDTYGHAAGDLVLQSLAKSIKKNLRENDCFIRWGGEEFIVVLEVQELSQLTKIAQKLCDAVAKIKLNDIREFTASFGATLLQKEENIDQAIQRADSALYEAKAQGKNRVVSL